MRGFLPGIIAGLCIVAGAGSVNAQDINDAVTIEDLGLTRRLHAGARAAGMAGAYTAVGEDAHSLIYNPAGLARIRRIELSLGFQHQVGNLKSTFFDAKSEVELGSTGFDYAAGAYPMPTYRGSLVFAAGVYRIHSSDLDMLYTAYNESTDTFDDYRLQQSGAIYSWNFGCGVDIAPNVSIGANVFFLNGKINALTQFSYEIPPPLNTGDFSGTFLVDDARVDVDGYGATVGLQFDFWPGLQLGLSVATPTWIKLSGDALEEYTDYYESSPDSAGSALLLIEQEMRLPFRADLGISITVPGILFTAEVGYVDWTQAAVNGIRLKDSRSLKPIFKDVIEGRAGLELTLPVLPLRLRAGYAYLPYPLQALQADRITNDSVTEAEVDEERHVIAAGAGLIVGKVLTLDAAAEVTKGRRSIPTLGDERTVTRLLISASYRY